MQLYYLTQRKRKKRKCKVNLGEVWLGLGRCHWTVEAQVTLGVTGPKNNGQPNCKAHRTEVIEH